MVMAVLRDSPAARAGLKPDDLLVEIDGKALASQEELARAANTLDEGDDGVVHPHTSHITLLREGDRRTVEITPSPRPTGMTVSGAALSSFYIDKRSESDGNRVVAVRNYVLGNGSAAQVGPGYRIDLSGKNASALSDVSIKQIVSKGQTLILTQEQDANGAVKMSITVGGQRYAVEAGKLDALPAELRPIGEQLLAEAPAAATHPAPVAAGGAVASGGASLDQRVKELEKKNQELQEQLADLLRMLPAKKSDSK
jgi:hypothetical protein